MKNLMKLQAPFDRLLSYDIDPHIALRKAIILQAIIDSTSVAVDRKAMKAKKEARDWILGNDDYFQEICFEGDLDSQEMIALTREMIYLVELDEEKKKKLASGNSSKVFGSIVDYKHFSSMKATNTKKCQTVKKVANNKLRECS